MTETAASAPSTSPWSPLRHRWFFWLWLAGLLSNVGTWMNDVGASWLMTTLATSPTLVALVQSATSFPAFLFALPAGALADIVDKRRLLFGAQLFMTLTCTGFAVLVFFGLVTPHMVLLYVFMMGTGAAITVPALQSVMPKLVPAEELQSAVALGSLGTNISRAIGPAVGGLLIVLFGVAVPFFVNALSFVVMLVVLWKWRPAASTNSTLPAEHMMEAMRAGIHYARASRALRHTLWRALFFFGFASAFWALLPLITRNVLQGEASLYGVLMALVGAGAVGGAFLLPRFRRLSPDLLVNYSTVAIVVILTVMALLPTAVTVGVAALCFGVTWIVVVSTLNVSAQLALPDWVRARGLSVYLAVMFGAMSVGSAVWGQLAGLTSLSTSQLVAAAVGLLGLLIARRLQLHQGKAINHAPSGHWPAPVLDHMHAKGMEPALTLIHYQVQQEHREAFLKAVSELSGARRRLGSYAWDILEDAENPGHFTESFRDLSWLAHMRHHERVSESDRQLQDALLPFLVPGTRGRVTHLLSRQT